MTFGQRLRALRKSKNLTQQQLADQLRLNRATYAKYETGSHQADYQTLRKLADFFGVSIDYLLGRTDNPQAPWSHRGTPSKDLAEFARRLRRAREDRGLTVEDLAAEVGLTTAETARFEQAPAGFPAAGTLNRLAECLGVTMAYLVADVDDPHDPGPADAWYQPKELSRILEDSEIMFDGVPLTEEDKRRIKDILTGLFWEAKQMNRKRQHKSPPRHPSDP